jgi:hypothetical protein
VAEARVKTAQGACAFVESFLAQRKGGNPNWTESRTHLESALSVWGQIGGPPSDATANVASESVAVFFDEELEYFAKKFLVETNVRLLKGARDTKNKAEWAALDKQIVELLDTSIPREKALRDDWNRYTRQIPSP